MATKSTHHAEIAAQYCLPSGPGYTDWSGKLNVQTTVDFVVIMLRLCH